MAAIGRKSGRRSRSTPNSEACAAVSARPTWRSCSSGGESATLRTGRGRNSARAARSRVLISETTSGDGDRGGRRDLGGIAGQKARCDCDYRESGHEPDAACADHGRSASSRSTRWSEASACSRSASVSRCVLKRASSNRSVSAGAAPALTGSRRIVLPRNSLAVSSRARTILDVSGTSAPSSGVGTQDRRPRIALRLERRNRRSHRPPERACLLGVGPLMLTVQPPTNHNRRQESGSRM